jgi:hypothetical protein
MSTVSAPGSRSSPFRKDFFMKTILIASLTGGALLFSTAAFADLAGELNTAQTHASLAAKAADINGVHMHLHHALNCLVGPGGTGFDTTNANPCANAGKGILVDSTDAAQKAKLQTAVTQAQAGIAATDLAAAQADATATASAIGSAK